MDNQELVDTLAKLMEKHTETIIDRLNKLELEIKPLKEDNKILKEKVEILENKLKSYENKDKRSNLIFYGIPENKDTEIELITKIINIIKKDLDITLEDNEVATCYRLGRYVPNKNRPVLIKFLTLWKRTQILKNKKKISSGIKVAEDFPKEVLIKRQELQGDLKKEREQGNIAFLKYDKLVVIPKSQREIENSVNKKRPLTISPPSLENNDSPRGPRKIKKKDAFTILKERALLQSHSSAKQTID